ncbi:hypothetical protein OH492_25040 [Vibrio chagasii]|nr:hypothetical protein [Vibrio chagasii]
MINPFYGIASNDSEYQAIENAFLSALMKDGEGQYEGTARLFDPVSEDAIAQRFNRKSATEIPIWNPERASEVMPSSKLLLLSSSIRSA